MYIIYYRTKENVFQSVKNKTIGIYIGGTTKKYILSNTKQYKTIQGAQRVAESLLSTYPSLIAETKVIEFSKFVQYLDNLTCKCGCDTTILPIGGGCYNIPKVGIIRPQCYDIIVPKKYQGTVLACREIENYIANKHKE